MAVFRSLFHFPNFFELGANQLQSERGLLTTTSFKSCGYPGTVNLIGSAKSKFTRAFLITSGHPLQGDDYFPPMRLGCSWHCRTATRRQLQLPFNILNTVSLNPFGIGAKCWLGAVPSGFPVLIHAVLSVSTRTLSTAIGNKPITTTAAAFEIAKSDFLAMRNVIPVNREVLKFVETSTMPGDVRV